MKSFLQNNNTEIYSMINEESLLLMKNLLTPSKKYIYKYLTSILKNAYIDELDDIVNKYYITYHKTIKMKPVDIKSNTYINSSQKLMR